MTEADVILDLRQRLHALEILLQLHHEVGIRGARAGDVCPVCLDRGALPEATKRYAQERGQ